MDGGRTGTVEAPTPLTPPSGADHLPRRAWLPPVLRRAWRAVGVLQIGVDPDRAVVVHGVTPALYQLIRRLDGRRSTEEVVALAVAAGATRTAAHRLLLSLTAAGCLVDLEPDALGRAVVGHPEEQPRLLADVALRVLGERGLSPQEVLARRAAASVVIHGGRRVGTALGTTLGAAGVGRVTVLDEGVVDHADVLPGGCGSGDIGRSRANAAQDAIRRSAPAVDTRPPESATRPDLVVVTEPWPEPGERERLLGLTGSASLYATVREGRAVVGPFVVPGLTSCLRCQQLHRLDRDAGWSAVVAQLRLLPSEPGGSGPLSLLAASMAASQALDWIDTRRPPASADTTLELTTRDLTLLRRPWGRHPACGCERWSYQSTG